MSDENQTVQPTVKTGWSSVQVYTLSAICLLIGVTMGYLFRGSNAPRTPASAASAAVQEQMPSGNPAAGVPPGTTQPTDDDMKRMADKQVAPLLDQLKSNPKDADTLAKVAHFYLVAKQFGDAATYYEQANAAKPNPETLTQLSIAYYYSGTPDAPAKTIDALNRALKIDPNYANALFDLGMVKWQDQGDTKGAIALWEKLVKTNPNHPRRAEVEKMIAKAKEHEKIPPGTKTDKPAM